METAGLAGLASSVSTFIPRQSSTTNENKQKRGHAAQHHGVLLLRLFPALGTWRGAALRVYATIHTTHTIETDTGGGGGSGQPHHAANQPCRPELCSSARRGSGSGPGHPEGRLDTAAATGGPGWCAPRRATAAGFFLGRGRGVRRGGPLAGAPKYPAAGWAAGPSHGRGRGRRAWRPACCCCRYEGLQVQYLLGSRRGGPAEAGGIRWKPTACRFNKNLTE